MAASSSPTTLIPNGISNARPGSTLESYMAMDPTALHEFFDECDYTISGIYTSTGTSAAALALGAPATYGAGGWLVIGTASAAGGVGDQIQLGAASFSFVPPSGVPAYSWFKIKVFVADATNTALAFGLMETISATTAIPSYTDGVWFSKAGASTTININAKTGSANVFTPVAVGTLANSTAMTLGYFYDGINANLNVYVNGVNSVNIPNFVPTTAAMNPTAAVFATTTAAQVIGIDHLFAANLRQPLS